MSRLVNIWIPNLLETSALIRPKRIVLPVAAILLAFPVQAQSNGPRADLWMHGWDWGHSIIGFFMMIVALGGVVLLVVLAERWFGGRPTGRPAPLSEENSAVDILNERFARGEIDQAEYEERKTLLSS